MFLHSDDEEEEEDEDIDMDQPDAPDGAPSKKKSKKKKKLGKRKVRGSLSNKPQDFQVSSALILHTVQVAA